MTFHKPHIVAVLVAALTAVITSLAVQALQPQQSPAARVGAATIATAVELPETKPKEVYAKDELGAEAADTTEDINYILYRYGRMERMEKGLWLAPDVPLPPCDETVRGLVWFVKDEKGDGLLVCVKSPSGETIWQQL